MAEHISLFVPAFEAGIFDLDGVVTDTASAHFQAWKRLFDELLQEEAPDQEPFSQDDYLEYVDGKPRREGLTSFLEARGLELDDEPGGPGPSLDELAARKNDYFHERLELDGVTVFEDAVTFLEQLRERGLAAAVVSSSRNCQRVLEAAELTHLFDARVDGTDLDALDGKPAPDMFLEAARRLGVDPTRAFMVEDARVGVEAGRAGGFGIVLGMDREGGDLDALREHGADAVLRTLAHVELEQRHDAPPTDAPSMPDQVLMADALPDALDHLDEILDRLGEHPPAVFLDFDGTLAPIVERPEDAAIADGMRPAISRLTARCPVAVVSGRDLSDVRERVGLEEIAYAGSHGFDICTASGESLNPTRADELVPRLDELEEQLREPLEGIDGAQIERKRYSLAIHYRRVADDQVDGLQERVEQAAGAYDELRLTHGKKVLDVQPDLDWDKGRAVDTLLDALEIDPDQVVPLYLGDDVTDEDAFEALSGRGVSVIVRQQRDRATAADYELESPDQVRELLDALADALEAR